MQGNLRGGLADLPDLRVHHCAAYRQLNCVQVSQSVMRFGINLLQFVAMTQRTISGSALRQVRLNKHKIEAKQITE